jgi:hypothetical protein
MAEDSAAPIGGRGRDILAAGSLPAKEMRFRLQLTIGGVLRASTLAEAQALVASVTDALSQAIPELAAVEVATSVQQIP